MLWLCDKYLSQKLHGVISHCIPSKMRYSTTRCWQVKQAILEYFGKSKQLILIGPSMPKQWHYLNCVTDYHLNQYIPMLSLLGNNCDPAYYPILGLIVIRCWLNASPMFFAIWGSSHFFQKNSYITLHKGWSLLVLSF